MDERDNTRLRDMLTEASRAQKFVTDRTQDDLYSDDMLAYAVIRTLQIIGEAASKVSFDMQTCHPQIAWR